jgi:hypothetical protein
MFSPQQAMQFPCHSANDVAICGRFYRPSCSAGRRHFVRHGKSVPKSLSVTVLVLSLIIFVLMPRTANLGGSIRHTEIHPDFTVDGKQKRLLTSEAARPTSKIGYKMAIQD